MTGSQSGKRCVDFGNTQETSTLAHVRVQRSVESCRGRGWRVCLWSELCRDHAIELDPSRVVPCNSAAQSPCNCRVFASVSLLMLWTPRWLSSCGSLSRAVKSWPRYVWRSLHASEAGHGEISHNGRRLLAPILRIVSCCGCLWLVTALLYHLPSPQRGLTFGRGYDRHPSVNEPYGHPSVDEPLGAVTAVTPVWMNIWARLRPLPQSYMEKRLDLARTS